MDKMKELKKRTARLSVALTDDRLEGLKNLAKILGVSVNELLNDTIEKLLQANNIAKKTAQFEENQRQALADFNAVFKKPEKT